MADPLRQEAGANCLIISANRVVTPYPVFPLGAACVAAALKRAGHRAQHFDFLAGGGLDGLQEVLSENRFDLVGMSIRNIDSVDSSDPEEYLADLRMVAACVRDNSKAPLVLGGPGFSIMPENIMGLLEADYGIVGEGERSIVRLAEAVAAGSPLPLERLLRQDPPLREFGHIEICGKTADYYLTGGGMLNLQTKRGCPYNCSYCSYPTIEGKAIRYREPEAVVDDFERLAKENGARYIFFSDSVFNDPAGQYLELAELLARRGNTIPWCAFFRPAGIGNDDLQLLQKAGLAAMELGTDAVTDETLAGLNKTFDFAEVERVHQRIVAGGIPSAHFVIFGGPGETPQTLQQGLKNMERLSGSVVFPFLGIRILPGTGIYDRSLNEGLIESDDPLMEPVFYYSPHVSRQEMEQQIAGACRERQEWVYPCHEFNGRIAMLHKMGHAGPLWDLLLRRRQR